MLELLLVIALYATPGLIAVFRDHPSKGGIIAMDLLLGWTVVFWLWAFIWSLSDTSRHGGVTVINNNR